MTCKDCVHDDVCEHWKNSVFGSDALYPKENDCEHFKNKADFVEVKHAEWVRVADTYGKEYLCSACKEGIRQYIGQPYCSRCGAKMDGGAE